MSNELPAGRQRSFEEFIASLGVDNSSVSAAHKIVWLNRILEGGDPVAYPSLRTFGRGLSMYGPSDEMQRRQQAQLVDTYTLDLRGDRRFPPSQQRFTMPISIFRKVLAQLELPTRGAFKAMFRARMRTTLLTTWTTGLLPAEFVRIKGAWVEQRADGFCLHIQGNCQRRTRDLPVPRSGTIGTQANDELASWLARGYGGAEDYIFPALDRGKGFDPSRPSMHGVFGAFLTRVLSEIGESTHYDFRSIRRSFLVRCRDELGLVATFYLSGYWSIDILQRALATEPEWSSIRNLF